MNVTNQEYIFVTYFAFLIEQLPVNQNKKLTCFKIERHIFNLNFTGLHSEYCKILYK